MIEVIVLFLIALLVMSFVPFVSSLMVPTLMRELIVVLVLITVTVLTIRKRRIFNFLIVFAPLAVVFTVVWRSNSPDSLPDIVYLLSYMIISVGLLRAMVRMPRLGFVLSRFLLGVVLFLSVFSILAFMTYNLQLLPFRAENLGGFAYYRYYHNPLVGYIDIRAVAGIPLGRVSGFMVEPSFTGWFLASNFFLLDRYFKKRELKGIVCKVIVFLGTACTCSTGAMIVLTAVIGINLGFLVLRRIGFGEKGLNVVAWFFILALPMAFIFIPKDSIGEKMGGSATDREGRMEATLLVLGTSSMRDLVLGHSPGFIEKAGDNSKGESNAYLKLLVEEGILVFLLICGFIVYCTKGNRNYMMATLIFLNSVIFLTTPLFVVNLVLSKWLDIYRDQKQLKEEEVNV